MNHLDRINSGRITLKSGLKQKVDSSLQHFCSSVNKKMLKVKLLPSEIIVLFNSIKAL